MCAPGRDALRPTFVPVNEPALNEELRAHPDGVIAQRVRFVTWRRSQSLKRVIDAIRLPFLREARVVDTDRVTKCGRKELLKFIRSDLFRGAGTEAEGLA